MLNTKDFVACIRDNLKDRHFGKERGDKIVAEFEARAEFHKSNGVDPTTSNTLAMREVFDNMSQETMERAKRTAKALQVQADDNLRIEQGVNAPVSMFLMDGKRGSRGVALARAAVSKLEHDPRFAGANYTSTKDSVRGQLYALFGDALENVSKGAFGLQKGKAHLPNIIREIKGEKTGDAAAKDFARAWLKVQNIAADLFNAAGGSMRKLENYVPQSQNGVKLVKAGYDRWRGAHIDGLDWARMRWPDGSPIKAEDREGVLKAVFDTLTSDGANKIDPKAFRGRGRAVGNALNQHRFLHYKDAATWLAVHEEFGEGNVFEVFTSHIEDMAHRIALVETFGPNPEAAVANLEAIVKKHASNLSARDKADAEAVLKNKLRPMFETVTRANPMDPDSGLGNTIVGLSNILTSAQLGSASFLAIPGDFMQTAAVRSLNNMGLFDGVQYYMGALLADPKFARSISAQSGFIMDDVVSSTYATTRYTGLATSGPAVTRRIADATMRLSLLSGHTKAARWATQAEFMGLMDRMRTTKFEDLPFRRVMERYQITAQEWDVMRQNIGTWEPRKDTKFMRPIDILNTAVPNRQSLYRKFQGMIFDESRAMIPESTVEGATTLKNTSRPDTLAGALLHSFAMYKNFPVSFMMIYGRLGMTNPTKQGRLAFFAGLGAAMTLVGALGTQMREISKGKEPLPMNNLAFLGKAFLSGGALSIWGDFLFAGVNEYGRGPADLVGGPLVGLLGDTTQLVLGDAFAWADAVGGLGDKEFESNSLQKAVEFAKRYTPGSSIWWARLALEREVWDRLTEIADPQAYQKRQRQAKRQQETMGNGYWSAPGERLFTGN